MNLLVVDPGSQIAAQVRGLVAEQADVTIGSVLTGTDAWMVLDGFRHPFDAVVSSAAH